MRVHKINLSFGYIYILCLLLVFSNSFPTDMPCKCGYEKCTEGKPGMLNVHLVCHSHDDVGWLKTVDQYYYGAKNEIQHAGVQYILDSIMQELLQDPSKKFSYCESAFLSRWFNQQHDSVRHSFQNLVNKGQLEIVGGGWSSNDEAATHYSSIIDQMTFGLNFLNRVFGECGRPLVAWQIDTFGHSAEQAALFALMGFDGLFFGRVDYQDKENRIKSKTLENMWKASKNLGDKASIFSGILPNGYNPPDGFCFDQFCADSPIMDDPKLEDYNVNERVDKFLKTVHSQAAEYKSQDLIMTMGSDFMYENAHFFMKNLDKLIKYVNERQKNGSNVNIFYSTPACYLYALYKANITWTTKSDDYFPYASDPHAYWTGYFTSRPSAKYQERLSNNFLQFCKQIHAIATFVNIPSIKKANHAKYLKDALGIMQHHDAISGTAKQAVADDYSKRLFRGVNECQESIQNSYNILMSLDPQTPLPKQEFCFSLNASDCGISALSNSFIVTVYNPLGWPIKPFLSIPTNGRAYSVQNSSGIQLDSQLILLSPAVNNLPERQVKSTMEFAFQADVPAAGFSTYFISQLSDNTLLQETVMSSEMPKNFFIENEFIRLTFDDTGNLKTFTNLRESLNISLTQSFYWYSGMTGNNSKPEMQASGAYIFRPNGSASQVNEKVKVSIKQGKLVQEVYQEFNDWIAQTIRLRKGEPFVEFDWIVGPIPINDNIGKEIITRYDTNIHSKGVFYTDANGREIIQRIRNYRPTWKLNVTEPIACNYFPVNSRIFLQDNQAKVQLTILTDRSQGGSSQYDGSLELMIHRRLLHDDGKGVNEALNEDGTNGKGLIVRGKHYVMLNNVPVAPRIHRILAQMLYNGPVISFIKSGATPKEWKSKFRTEFSALNTTLPPNVHLLTSELLQGHPELLIRLEHIFEKDEDSSLWSKPATVDLKYLFNGFITKTAQETTLSANLPLKDLDRLQWIYKGGRTGNKLFKPVGDDLIITLNPMEIRTFFLTLSKIK